MMPIFNILPKPRDRLKPKVTRSTSTDFALADKKKEIQEIRSEIYKLDTRIALLENKIKIMERV